MTLALALPSRAEETSLMVTFQVERSAVAFEDLYRLAAPGLLDWISRFVATRRLPIDPAEALQDTFVNIYRYVSSFRSEASGGFRAWARTIASNAIRRARRRPVNGAILFSEVEGPLEQAADRRSSPFNAALDAESSADLRSAYSLFLLQYAAAFETLRPRDKEALRMVEVDGLCYEEVGRRLGVGRSNTKMIVFRARQRLRAALHSALFGDERGGESTAPVCEQLCA